MKNYKAKTLMLTQEQIEALEGVIGKMKKNKLEMSLSSIVRILIDEHLEEMAEKFSFGGRA